MNAPPTRRRWFSAATAATAIVLAATLFHPKPAQADQCIDDAWAEYNRCLVSGGFWRQKLCDYAHIINFILCLEADEN